MPASLTFSTPTMVSTLGGFGHPDNKHFASEFKYTVTAASWSAGSGKTTYTVDGDIDTPNGSTFTAVVAGMSPSGYNGTFTGTVNNAARTTFTVTMANPGTATVMGTMCKNYAGLYSRPSIGTDTRQWNVYAADLAFPYDGKDGYVYCFYGDTFGSDWNGPGTTHSNAGSSTVAAASNGVAVNTFTGTQTLNIAGSGSFAGAGGNVVVQLSSASNALAHFTYGGKGTGTLTNVKLIACTSPTATLTTGDTASGLDGWTGAGWRSNTLMKSNDGDLSNGIISTFTNLSSQNIAQYAIPYSRVTEAATNVFPASKTISTVSRTSNVVTVTTSATHKFATGNVINISGVTDASFNGNFVVASTPSTTTFTYAQTAANASSSGGTAAQTVGITSISRSDGFTVNVTTTAAHQLSVGQGITIAGTGIQDGENIVRSVPTSTTFTTWAWGANSSASTGTVTPASFQFADPLDPADGSEGTVIPTGAIAITGQAAAKTVTAATWSAGTATVTIGSHTNYVGEDVLVENISPSGYNGTVTLTGVTGTTISYAVAANPGTYTSGGTVKGTRHYAYYMVIPWFSDWAGMWFTNYMGIAYSDDKGDNWTREGITGGTYNNADVTKVWSNDNKFNAKFQQAWPVDGQDGYVYCLCTKNGRFGDAYLMRVAKANILSKSSYTYWDGSTWNSSPTAATAVYTGPQAEPTVFYHSATSQWLSVMLVTDTYGGNRISVRNADSLTGPWTSEQILYMNTAFGQADVYGGWIHPWSNKAPQAGTDFYFLVSLFAPYNTYIMKTTITPAAGSAAKFFRMFNRG